MDSLFTAPVRIAPSILAADFLRLESEIRAAEIAGADWIHCDIMDGHFVPNISFGPLVVEAAHKATRLPLDVHLMISDPATYIPAFRKAGADQITVHAEACADLPGVLRQIRSLGARAGVSVNPDKPIDLFLPWIDQADLVLIMTVFAGFGGQKFMPEALPKIRAVREEILRKNLSVDLEVDGGINAETAREARFHGANALVAGSFIFGASDYRRQIDLLRSTEEA